MTAADRAYTSIRAAIANGAYRVGDPLPESELAGEAGISRTPVREALRRLDSEGIVELLPNRGARVAGWNAHDLEETFELRSQLEGYGARLAPRKSRRYGCAGRCCARNCSQVWWPRAFGNPPKP